MEAPSSPREASPAVAVLTATPPIPSQSQSRKRKYATVSGANTAAASPAPSDRAGTPNATPENVVIPTRQLDLASRPRLTISRHPSFIPIAPGSPYHSTEPLCFNRLNFRYTPAGLSDPSSTHPFRTIESAPAAFRVSWEDRSAFVKVTQDGLGLKGEKGFRSARCNAPVREGKWYMEVKVVMGGGDRPAESKKAEGSHVRIGWARREAPLNAPAGLDGYSYAVRDRTGEKVHISRLRPYGRSFKSGDVIGMYISLPSPRRQPNKKDQYDPAHIKRERIAIEFKGQEYFESLEYPQSKEMMALLEANTRAKANSSAPAPPPTKKSATVKNLPSTGRGGKTGHAEPAPTRPLPTLGPESCIAFFVNGESQGIAFQDIYDYLPLRFSPNKTHEKRRANKDGIREHKENHFDDGTLGYYPFISLFNEAEVRLNPGPHFDFPPPADIDAVLMSPTGAVEADVKPVLDAAPKWRPMCERYPEYMSEQFVLDQLEDGEAQSAAPQANPKTKEPRDAKEPPSLSETKESRGAGVVGGGPREPAPDVNRLERHRAKRREQAARRRERKLQQHDKEPSVSGGGGGAGREMSGVSTPGPQAPDTPHKTAAAESRDASMEVDSMLVESTSRYSSPGGGPGPVLGAFSVEGARGVGVGAGLSPALTVGSVGDVQSYWLGAGHDTSEYNTEYEDAGTTAGDGDPDSQGPDIDAPGGMEIDEELARLS